jgi:hypothetical protein
LLIYFTILGWNIFLGVSDFSWDFERDWDRVSLVRCSVKGFICAITASTMLDLIFCSDKFLTILPYNTSDLIELFNSIKACLQMLRTDSVEESNNFTIVGIKGFKEIDAWEVIFRIVVMV